MADRIKAPRLNKLADGWYWAGNDCFDWRKIDNLVSNLTNGRVAVQPYVARVFRDKFHCLFCNQLVSRQSLSFFCECFLPVEGFRLASPKVMITNPFSSSIFKSLRTVLGVTLNSFANVETLMLVCSFNISSIRYNLRFILFCVIYKTSFVILITNFKTKKK